MDLPNLCFSVQIFWNALVASHIDYRCATDTFTDERQILGRLLRGRAHALPVRLLDGSACVHVLEWPQELFGFIKGIHADRIVCGGGIATACLNRGRRATFVPLPPSVSYR